MIYSKSEAKKRAQAEHKAQHKYDGLIGKNLTWTEVGDGWESNLSSPIIKVHPNGQEFYVNECDEPRWIKAGKYVKNIQVSQ